MHHANIYNSKNILDLCCKDHTRSFFIPSNCSFVSSPFAYLSFSISTEWVVLLFIKSKLKPDLLINHMTNRTIPIIIGIIKIKPKNIIINQLLSYKFSYLQVFWDCRSFTDDGMQFKKCYSYSCILIKVPCQL